MKKNRINFFISFKVKAFSTLILLLTIFSPLVAQIDTTNWYPLSIGNKWQFSYYESISESSFITIEVMGDTTFNQKKYFILKSWNGLTYQRVENNNYVYEFSPNTNQEYIRYNFVSPDKSIWDLDSISGQYGIYSTEQHYVPIYGDSLKSKIYNFAYIDTNSTPPDTSWGPMVDGTAIYISKGVGITVYEQGIAYGKLQGAIINGKLFGTIITVNNDKKNVDNYRLTQNYPNPFNPTTTISYSLPKTGFVRLKVYDLLGREVESLVNKEQVKGNYKIEFNAFTLSSGIYFYNLQSGNFSETKKMVIMR